MSTHDYIVDNQNGANFRSDLNNALAAIVSNNSSATAPTTTYAFMLWADTANDLLKQRNAADSAWISILTLSTGAPLADYADNALSGNAIDGGTISNFTSTGIDDNATGTKLTISDTTITGVGAFTSTSIDATKLSGALPAISGLALTDVGLGVGQTWQDVTASRASATTYTNSTSRPIMVEIVWSASVTNHVRARIKVDALYINTSSAELDSTSGRITVVVIVPAGSTYRSDQDSSSGSITNWYELR